MKAEDAPDMLRVLILGDSTLSSLGAHFANAIDLFLTGASYDALLELRNLSAAGMTSADALAHFREFGADSRCDALIVYVGNCDSCSFGVPKARRTWLRWWRAVRARATPLTRRAKPYQFVAYPFPMDSPRACVLPGDYARFVRAILELARRRDVPVILCNPVAKQRFPPCNNLGNFAFYKIAGVEDRLPLAGDGGALREALELQSDGAFAEALARYEQILRETTRGESGFVAANNAAVVHFREGHADAALRLLESIPERGNPLHPLALFNRAIIHEARTEVAEARALFALAEERDSGTYRTTHAYRAALARVAAEAPGPLWYVDAGELLSDHDLFDYCHPNSAGHERLHAELRRCLERVLSLRPGPLRPVLECTPANPDRSAGDRRSWSDYLGITREPDRDFATALLERARSGSYAESLTVWDDLAAAPHERVRRRILAHPLFGCDGFLAECPPDQASDQGSFPELYFLRHMLPLHKARRTNVALSAIFSEVAELLPDPRRVASWWPALGARESSVERLSEVARSLDLGVVLQRAERRLRESLGRGPVVGNRYRTMTYWFLRESLVFGSTSHYSMYFDRVSLLDVLDACAFGLQLCESEALVHRFNGLLRAAADLLRVHRSHLTPVAHEIFRLGPAGLARYRADLARVASELPS